MINVHINSSAGDVKLKHWHAFDLSKPQSCLSS